MTPRLLIAACLCFALIGVGEAAADSALSRDELIGKLIPITGDPIRSVDLDVPFKLGSSELSDGAEDQLDALGSALEAEPLQELRVEVLGHTDASGPADYNLTLSERRAASVVAYLIENFELTPEKFEARGLGETDLLPGLAPNAAAHRRVEIVVHAPEKSADQPSDEPEGEGDSPAPPSTPDGLISIE